MLQDPDLLRRLKNARVPQKTNSAKRTCRNILRPPDRLGWAPKPTKEKRGFKSVGEQARPCRILVVDDHDLMREAIKAILKRNPSL